MCSSPACRRQQFLHRVPWDPPAGDTTGFTKIQIVFEGMIVGNWNVVCELLGVIFTYCESLKT